MNSRVTVRDLRNHGGEVLARVRAGETLTITSHGTPVAELRPLRQKPLTTKELIERRRGRRPLNAAKLIADIDQLIDQSI
jgi:prevent-host-death family protein